MRADGATDVRRALSVAVLGLLEVTVAGRLVVFTAGRLQTLLAVLAMSAGERWTRTGPGGGPGGC
jgi:hypothetical protein